MAVFCDLPVDVIDRVLMHLPDFNSLSAAIKTCKPVYDVFQTHPKSIAQAIAFNLVGPALPQALRVARFLQTWGLPDKDPEDVLTLSRDHAMTLSRNASTVSQLEDIYSLSCKDRTSPSSRLSDAESLRFCRAIYRLWEVWAIFLRDPDEDEDEDTDTDSADEDEYNPEDLFARHSINVKDYMTKLQNTDLFELDAAVSFLKEVVSWLKKSSNIYMSPGLIPYPNELLVCFKTAYPNHPLGLGHFGFDLTVPYVTFDNAISSVFQARSITQAKRDTERPKAVLDKVIGENDLCHRCDSMQGLRLWGRTNFSLFRGYLSLDELYTKLNGRLPANRVEISALRSHVTSRDAHNQPDFDWTRFFEELCDTPTEAEGVWDKEQYYCKGCVEVLMHSRLTNWWLAKKRQLNMPIGDDCWYGYACRTQTHKSAHAERLNHLCQPTRGDGYVPRATGDDTA